MRYKYHFLLEPEALAEVLKGVAGAAGEKVSFQSGKDESAVLIPEAWEKIKLKCKKTPHGVEVELSLKTAGEPVDSEDEQIQMPYKVLKKSMKKTFREITDCIREQTFPDEATLAGFWASCRNMTGYKGYGDAFYAVFLEGVGVFVTACREQRLEEAESALRQIQDRVKDCHAYYK